MPISDEKLLRCAHLNKLAIGVLRYGVAVLMHVIGAARSIGLAG